jgi:hypothetical protein
MNSGVFMVVIDDENPQSGGPSGPALKNEDGTYILNEDGTYILLEEAP